MRPILALIAGGPERVSLSAAAIVAIIFVWAVLALIAQATGVADGEAAAPAPKEADHG